MLTSTAALLLATLAVAPPALLAQADTDKDGLSDFLETHKYLTDPAKADSDNDGTPDGDWLERREYTYTVRSVVQVMRPVTPGFLNDAYQDARVLDETETYVELEVIHYPFVDLKGVGKDGAAENVAAWLAPGPTSNASPKLGRAIRAAMEQSGAEAPDLGRGEGVAQAARWLLGHAKHQDRFTTFITGVDNDGKFFIPDDLAAYTKSKSAREGLSPEEAWPREIEAAGMFEHGERGSCTSSAIYLSGCLRALGVPTRTVLCVPIIDAGDEHEWKLLKEGVQHHSVRAQIESALEPSRNGWSSHTFNEVYVEGRWHRLNYSDLDAGVLNEGFFGLMTHVATFHDWADARMWETVGRRSTFSNEQKKGDAFGHHNPYSTIALEDQFGAHCKLENPPVETSTLTVEAMHWTDSKELPQDIVTRCHESQRFGLIAEVPAPSMKNLVRAIKGADRRVHLTGADVPTLSTSFDLGCIWFRQGRGYVYLPFGKSDRRDLREGVPYQASARNQRGKNRWVLDAVITR